MLTSKKNVDDHVASIRSYLSEKEFKNRSLSIARFYFKTGDYVNCRKYVELYLTHINKDAAAYKLLGEALKKLGDKERALESYKTSFEIDPTQTSTILDICELLASDDLPIEPGSAQYWCDKAVAIYPKDSITFRLREKLTMSNPDPEALIKLLKAELSAKPRDPSLHARLIKHYISVNNYKEAFEHGCNIEFTYRDFLNTLAWYESLDQLLKQVKDSLDSSNDWLYQLLLLTVRERICALSLTDKIARSFTSLETNELLKAYDQALEQVTKAGAPEGFADFHVNLLQHHRGQFAFHAATFILKKAKTGQTSWREASKASATLMLIAWQTRPIDSNVSWLKHAADKLLNAASRWCTEGAFRCSQAGHYLISNYQDKNQSLLDQIAQCCSGSQWKDKLFEQIFIKSNDMSEMKSSSSHFLSNSFKAPALRFPKKIEVEAYDSDAQKLFGNSLHHFVWTLLNYKNYAHFKCTLFEMLTPTVTSCGPETLSKLDVHAFLYCAALTARQQKGKEVSYQAIDKPEILPANITDLLCPISQIKWWDCAYKFSQKLLGTEFTDVRETLSRGMKVVLCIDNHGLDPELLCILGRIFSERAKITTSVEEKSLLEKRACLYYRSAIPLLEKLKSNLMINVSDTRMFDYTHKRLETSELILLIEESTIYVAVDYINDCEYDQAIQYLANVKSATAYYHLAQIYKKIAQDEGHSFSDCSKTKYAAILTKAKNYAYKTLNMLKDTDNYKNNPIYIDAKEIVNDIKVHLNKIDTELSCTVVDSETKYSSDENCSLENEPRRVNNHIFRNISSTPKATNPNITNYRTAMDSQIFEMTRLDQHRLDRIENEIMSLQKRDTAMSDFMAQTKDWFDENRKLGNQIMNTMNSNIQDTTDQFRLLKISIDQVKDQTDACRDECKDVVEMKKQIADLKKEVNKLKGSSTEQSNIQNNLFNYDEEYRNSEPSSNYASQYPTFPPQMLPQFNQRPPFPVPPNPYQFYNQSFNLYNQYKLAQSAGVPGSSPLFDARAQLNYPGWPTPDQMYVDMAHLIQPTVPAAPAVPAAAALPTMPMVPTLPTMPTVPSVPAHTLPTSTSVSKIANMTESKETTRTLPANVVITSSDPLPTCVSDPAPVLSVTIPPKHIKGTPHNYQIAMPTANDSKIVSPPVFSFSLADNKNQPAAASTWKQTYQTFPKVESLNFGGDSSLDTSKTVVDGALKEQSPNTSINKSRTLSEKSNTSVENYDPCPDFKPIVPLPAEIKVTTGEEDEIPIFSARAKLFRFTDKQWKERGIGDMKLLKHAVSGKVRVLMRREQVHKICANHIITSDMEIKLMKNETKSYFWVANDFADERLVLEKFCIRFKTADIASDFYKAFENARQEAITATPNTTNDDTSNQSENKKIIAIDTNTLAKEVPVITQSKTEVGGFTFSGTPIFKSVENDTKTSEANKDLGVKSSVFSGLSFKTATNSPFSNLFDAASNSAPISSTTEKVDTNVGKLNTSDTTEEFEPNVEFKPVIPLPALVELKTGEEDETVLFEHRAKLLRFVSVNNTKEWKERGLGIMKLLAHKSNNQKIRLLMRREQIMKVCCNHAVTKDMLFEKMPNMDTAVTWCAKDFSEGELVAETFCLRFKTVQICDDFMDAIKLAQSNLKDESKAAKEEQNAAKQINQSGFGDKFKAKPGSWHCDACYTNNLETFTKCACCDQPKVQSSTTPDSNTINSKTITETSTSTWGDKFKPKQGSWECQSCLLRNEYNLNACSACNSPKDPKAVKSVSNISSETKPKFSFGIPSQTAESIQNHTKTQSIEKSAIVSGSGFGDKFKPKEGSWECKQCLVSNIGENDTCVACNSAKDPNALKKSTNILETTQTGVKFRFGIPATTTGADKPKTETSSIFDGTGAHKFTFGIPTTTTAIAEQKPTGVIFAAPKSSSVIQNPINLSLKVNEPTHKPALLPTPETDNNTSFASKESGTFDFVFKPAMSCKSPVKSPNKSHGDESDEEDYVKEEDCHAHFNPVIPMPEKVEVITGEENEVELFSHRARLYRFDAGEWKERGTGDVKILKHKETNKLRIVMRREQVLKICLNHALTQDITYTPKDEKSWLFAANDFSEGELNLQKLCLRFQNKDVAGQFKEAVENAREGKAVPKVESSEKDDEVVFVSETLATTDEKKKAKELMLPENFYTYKNKDPCQGCRGCKDDDEVKSDKPSTDAIKAILSAPAVSAVSAASTISTPVKSIFPTFQSPTSSLYGTPENAAKTFDTSIFRTPLEAIGSDSGSSALSSSNSSMTGIDATNKENVFTQNKNVFSNIGEQKSIFSSLSNSPVTVFGGGDSQVTTTNKSSVIAPPVFNIPGKSQSDAKTVFAAAAQTNSIFGGTGTTNKGTGSIFGNTSTSVNNSIFGFTADKPKTESNTEVKSIFGGNKQNPVNLFSGTTEGSQFGLSSLGNQNKPVFSMFGSGPQNNVFKTILPNTTNQTAVSAEQAKPEVSVFSSGDNNSQEKQQSNAKENEAMYKMENTTSFAALFSQVPELVVEKKADFKWDGAGQQLFVSSTKTAGGADDDYDPHYEPIVPLPEKIVVSTGEEDEEKVFGERCKLYRYDDKTREWKERGVGELKILYHPQRNTYRLLLRREQVHKAVLNMLIFMELELLPMKQSVNAWTWNGRNFAEGAAGELETLAVRFKSENLAKAFHEQVKQATRKLQAAAAKAIRDEQEAKDKVDSGVSPLRVPKNLQDSSRAEDAPRDPAPPEQTSPDSKQVHFEETDEYQDDKDDEDYDQDDYDAYYNEEEDDTATYYSCDAEAVVRQGDVENATQQAHIQVMYDQEIYSPKILVTEANTGEILADMIILADTEFHMNGDTTVYWSGTDHTTNEPVDKTVTVNFYDSDTAMQFYDSCETTKTTSYSSNAPESYYVTD